MLLSDYAFGKVRSRRELSTPFIPIALFGAGRSSGGRALARKGWDHPIEPAWCVDLQFGLFSILTNAP